MKLSLDVVKINYFDKFLHFIHASSPRYFENKKGELKQYNFKAKKDLEKKSNHIKRFMKTVEIKNTTPYLLNQVHSDQIFCLKDVSQTQDQVSKINADALITHLDETPIGVFTADCIPVLLCDIRLHVVAAIHAGRKGTQKNIVNKTIVAMQQEYGCAPKDLVAGMGPGIGGCCYEVDQDCFSLFEKKIPYASSFVKKKKNGKLLLDLFAVNIQQALDAGLLFENIFPSGECTFCSPRNYFSYRREGQTGRILTFIMLQKSGLT
ncbi:MAG: peptidoglycan editing factor PgeF [Nitrospinota bacterium]|nr:peptidoglycan editing factor PgeF [Nitrospinota bacterium]